MGKARIITKSHNIGLYKLKSYEGNTIEEKITALVENNEPIKDTSPLIYTEKKDGVRPEFNIRTDKWEIAQNAMNRIAKEKIAKGIEIEGNKTPDGGEGETSRLPTEE